MARVFLDTNYFIDVLQRNTEKGEQLDGQEVFSSPLSYHILSYIHRLHVPNEMLIRSTKNMTIVPFDERILHKSLQGPTNDLEDNVQLNSSAQEDCDYFLTNDRKLLNMKFFGKMMIVSELPKN